VDSRRADLPAPLRAFLYSCIDSIEQLEVLMLLKESGQAWSAGALAQEIGVADGRSRASLEALAARGLAHATVKQEVQYSFRPASDTLAGYCDDLSEQMRRDRAAVLRFVSTLPPPAIRSFAKAFRLRDSGE
jgi:hypothetical protein